MTTEAFPPVDITAQWGRLNDTLVALVDYVPDDKLEWSPREELWNFKGILLHTAMARDGWMGRVVKRRRADTRRSCACPCEDRDPGGAETLMGASSALPR